MSIVEVLYIILGVCVVVITVTIVWLANETMRLVKSLRRSSEDVEFMTNEVKEKILMVSEALDRAGTAASNIIGLVEDAIAGIKEKRDQLSDSIGLITGVGEYFKKRKSKSSEDEEDEAVGGRNANLNKKERRIEAEISKEDKETEDLVEEIAEKPVKKEEKEVKIETKSKEKEEIKPKNKAEDVEDAKPLTKDTPKK